MEANYYIKIDRTGRYVARCDENWYETEPLPIPRYTKSQADDIVKQMRKHYVYDVTVSNGTETYRGTLKPVKPVEPVSTGKKNFIFTRKK